MSKNGILGVLGGMGPVASAEFLKTIYEYSEGEREQEFPVVFVYSDPTFPDRTDAFLKGEEEVVLRQLVKALQALVQMDASKIVICCMTIHHLLPRLSPELADRIISLLDVIADHLPRTEKKHLLICSSGTRRFRLFENHKQRAVFEDYLIFPSEEDQEWIHRDLIYPIKKTPDPRSLLPLLDSLLAKYGVDSFAAGCSEIHVLSKHLAAASNGQQAKYGCIDPLAIIARQAAENRL
jgi:aspartate racemase